MSIDVAEQQLAPAHPQEAEILEFFRNGYGDAYLGDSTFLTYYIRLAEKCVLVVKDEHIKSAALLRRERLAAVATNPTLVSRRDAMTNLLSITRLVEPEGWITIDEQAKPMVSAAKGAGMQIVYDIEQAQTYMDRFGETEEHNLAETVGGIVLKRTGSFHGKNYTQHMWAWPK